MLLAIVLFLIYFCFMSCLLAEEKTEILPTPELEIAPTEEITWDEALKEDEFEFNKPVPEITYNYEPIIPEVELEALFEVAFAQPEIQPQQRSESKLPNWGIREFKKWGSQWNKKHPQQRIKAIANLTKPQWEEIYLQLVT